MNQYTSYFLLLAFFLTTSYFAEAQDKCALPAYRLLQQKRHPGLASEAAFERWIEQKQEARKNRTGTSSRRQKEVYTLPVVVHVVHNGEALGVGANIPESQIIRQIEILNQDFRKRNTAQIEALPAAFRAVAADTEIEFALARQDPEGLPTNGINRLRGNESSYNYETNDYSLKSQIHWPAEDYINIYVTTLSSNFIGYAQFPETDQLQGLDKGLTFAQTDGIVVDYRYFGEGGNAVAASRGRTATHELGHYFGLLHTWGDNTSSCEADDYVQDTPPSINTYNGFGDCNATNQASCETPDMFQNYMYYTNDACMSLFTEGQKERIRVVLMNSPRRRELLDSRALQEPTIVANDAGLRQLVLGITDSCSKTFIPQLSIRNYGSNQLQEVDVALYVKGELFASRTIALNLGYLETEVVQLDEINYSLSGMLPVEARITGANSTADGKAFNNSIVGEIFIPEVRTPSFFEGFEASSYPFYRINPDFMHTWQQVTAPVTGYPNNLAMYMNFYDYLNPGAKDYLISPKIDLSDESQSYLSFKVAYAPYPNISDKLEVYVTTDCSETIENATLIYSKSGQALGTAPSTADPFVPRENEDWRSEFLDLSAFAGNSNVQLLFVGTNDYGNNLYLDDIEVIKESPYDYDVSLQAINAPSIVSCETSPSPAFLVRNTGRQPLHSLEVFYSVDGSAEKRAVISNLSLAPMASQQLYLPPLALEPGRHSLRLRVANPNGQPDESPSNNSLAKNFVIDQQEDVIPLRQQFSSPSFARSSWVSANPVPEVTGWEIRAVPGPVPGTNYAAASEFFEGERGAENWLVSPVLDLSDVEEAGMQFRYSYAPVLNASDILQVRVSTDCGLSWNHILFEKRGSELSGKTVNGRWAPRSISDWNTAFTNLSAFAGLTDIRVAFVAISDGGNNIYLDDIEFFESGLPLSVLLPETNSLTAYPNPTNSDLQVVFNLEEREDVLVQLFNMNGALMYRSTFPNTLNQVYTINMAPWQAGIYVLKVSSPSLQISKRILLFK